ncbi:hypothetical protein QQX98_007483 [Neonectria punicea]|uniref:NACHT domain-containing protein n=1 Tax=Neonectria punicea TaxID=979145 RepID=A0ABR1GXR5_9HYPO
MSLRQVPSLIDDEDIVVIDRDDISNYNDDNVLPESSKTIAKIRRWLNPTEYNLESGEYRRHLSSHLAGTGAWLPSLQKYQQWHDRPDHGLLWIKGIPGSGKSVFAATLAYMLAEEGVPVLFFFFRQIIHANHQPVNLIRDWLDQILLYSPPLQVILNGYVEKSRSLESVSMDDLWQHLRTALAQLPLVYCVVDALDEMDQGNDDFLRSLADLGRWRPSRVKVLMTSRPVPTVEASMRESDYLDVRLDEALVDVDISTYVHRTLENVSLSERDQDLIKKAIPGRANGLFLYAKLAMNSILEPNADVASVLQKLPLDLNEMYSGILEEHARRSGIPTTTQLEILQWVTHATRPLRLLELADLIKTTSDKDDLSLKANKFLIRAACGPLLEILPDETISVVHHSLTEFLVGASRQQNSAGFPVIEFESTHGQLALACLRYLRSDCLQKLDSSSFTPINISQHGAANWMGVDFPFLAYASSTWYQHATKCNWSGTYGSELSEQVEIFLSDSLVREHWLKTCWEYHGGSRAKHHSMVTDLHIAAFCGLSEYLLRLLENPGNVDIDVMDGFGKTPLWWASSRGFARTVHVLLKAGAKVNLADDNGVLPLHEAAAGGSSDVVRLLLEAGDTPHLDGACRNGHLTTVEVFLPYLTPDGKDLALHWAVLYHHARIVRRLLEEPDVDPNKLQNGATPLFLSTMRRDIESMEALVNAGADASIQCPDMTSPPDMLELHDKVAPLTTVLSAFCSPIPTETGYVKTTLDPVQLHQGFSLLIRAGADVNATTSDGFTALHLTKSPTLFKLLLEAGADSNAESKEGETALHPCPGQHGDDNNSWLRLLMEKGADINKKSHATGKTPLHIAVHEDGNLALKLLEYKPDCGVVDHDGNGPLHAAVACSDIDSMRVVLPALLEAGADPNLRNSSGETPLHCLAGRFRTVHKGRIYEEVFRLLVSHGAEINAHDSHGRTPLFTAISKLRETGFSLEMDFLRAVSANINVQDDQGRTVLHEAIRAFNKEDYVGDVEPVAYRYLVDAGISTCVVDFEGNTLVHEMAKQSTAYLEEAHISITLKECTKAGLDIDQPNVGGQTPLHLASQARLPSYRTDACTFLDVLLEKSKAIDVQDLRGLNPLHYAASTADYTVDLLLRKGANPFVSTREGMNALHIASRCRKSNILGRILHHMKRLNPSRAIEAVNQKDISEYTPLHYACRSGRPESVGLLLEAGAEAEPGFTGSYNINRGEPWLPPIFQCAFFGQEQLLWGLGVPESSNATAAGLTINDTSRPNDEYDDDIYPSSPIFHSIHHTVRCEEIIQMVSQAGGNLSVDSQWDIKAILEAMGHAGIYRDEYATDLLFRLYEKIPGAEIPGAEIPDSLRRPILMTKARRESDMRVLRETNSVKIGKANWEAVERCLIERQYSLIKELYKAGADFT